jgi:Rhs element Vgr protein
VPIPPRSNSDGVLRVSVTRDGVPLPGSASVVSVTVSRAINEIPSARLVIQDGDPATGAWTLADGATFEPGAVIAIQAGYGGREDVIFEGVVVGLGARADDAGSCRLVVECRDRAVHMTLAPRSAGYADVKDSDVIGRLVEAHGLGVRVDATPTVHAALAQAGCSDWDFLVARAERNGLLAIVQDGVVDVGAPRVAGEASLSVTWGVDLLEFEADIDARTQVARVEAVAWNPDDQALVREGPALPVSLNAQGNLSAGQLAEALGGETLTLAVPWSSESALADLIRAQQVRAGLSRIHGRVKFQGSAKARVGELIALQGVGARFSGDAFVSGLEHEIAQGQWTTEATFGLPPAPAAGIGALAGVDGLQIGVVTDLQDPDGAHRIRVTIPLLDPNAEVWARLSQAPAGAFVMPEVGDEVVLGFFGDDAASPVILGSLYSSARPAPDASGNDVTALVARVAITDDGQAVTVSTPGNNRVVLSDRDGSVRLEDQHGNAVHLGARGITLCSPGDIKITADGALSLEAAGVTTVKGGLVTIN